MPYGNTSDFLSAGLGLVSYLGVASGSLLMVDSTLTPESPVALGLLLGGLAIATSLAWRAARLVGRVDALERESRQHIDRIHRLSDKLDELRSKNGGNNA